jgi:hypothetical protein
MSKMADLAIRSYLPPFLKKTGPYRLIGPRMQLSNSANWPQPGTTKTGLETLSISRPSRLQTKVMIMVTTTRINVMPTLCSWLRPI